MFSEADPLSRTPVTRLNYYAKEINHLSENIGLDVSGRLCILIDTIRYKFDANLCKGRADGGTLCLV